MKDKIKCLKCDNYYNQNEQNKCGIILLECPSCGDRNILDENGNLSFGTIKSIIDNIFCSIISITLGMKENGKSDIEIKDNVKQSYEKYMIDYIKEQYPNYPLK